MTSSKYHDKFGMHDLHNVADRNANFKCEQAFVTFVYIA